MSNESLKKRIKEALLSFILDTPDAQKKLEKLIDEVWSDVAEAEKRRDC